MNYQIFKDNFKKILYFYFILAIPLVIYSYLFLKYYSHGLKIYDSVNSNVWIMIDDIIAKAKDKNITGFVEGIDEIKGISSTASKNISNIINLGLKKYKGWKIIDEEIRKDVVKKLNKYLSRYEVIDNKNNLIKTTLSEKVPDYIFHCNYSGISGQIMNAKITCSLVNSFTKELVFDSSFTFTKPFFEWSLKAFEKIVKFLSYFSIIIYLLTLLIILFYYIYKAVKKILFEYRIKIIKVKFNEFLENGNYEMCQKLIKKYSYNESDELIEMKNVLDEVTYSNIPIAQKAFLDFVNIRKIYEQTSLLNYEQQKRLSEIVKELNDDRVINFYANYVKKLSDDLQNKKLEIEKYIKNAEYVLASNLINGLLLFFPSDAELLTLNEKLKYITKNNPSEAQNAYITAKNIFDKIMYTKIVESDDIEKLEEISHKIEHPDIMKLKTLIKQFFAGERADIKKIPYIYSQIENDSLSQNNIQNDEEYRIKVVLEQIKVKKEEVIEKYNELIKNVKFKDAMMYIKEWINLIPELKDEYINLEKSFGVKRLKIYRNSKDKSTKSFYLLRKNFVEVFKKYNNLPDIALNYEYVSRDNHLSIEYNNGLFIIKDNNSKNGFTYNKEKIKSLTIYDNETIEVSGIYSINFKNIDKKILYFDSKDFNGFMIPNGDFKLDFSLADDGSLVFDLNSSILSIVSDGYGIGIKISDDDTYKIIASDFNIILNGREYEIKIY